MEEERAQIRMSARQVIKKLHRFFYRYAGITRSSCSPYYLIKIKNNCLQQTNRRKILFTCKILPSESTKKAIPYSQSLRLKRICSDDADYKENNKILLNKLVERGYQLEDTKKEHKQNTLVKTGRTIKIQRKNAKEQYTIHYYI